MGIWYRSGNFDLSFCCGKMLDIYIALMIFRDGSIFYGFLFVNLFQFVIKIEPKVDCLHRAICRQKNIKVIRKLLQFYIVIIFRRVK